VVRECRSSCLLDRVRDQWGLFAPALSSTDGVGGMLVTGLPWARVVLALRCRFGVAYRGRWRGRLWGG